MNTTKTKNLTVPYAFIQAGYWVAFGILLAFASMYFLEIGLKSNAIIGTIVAIGSASSALIQPVVGSYADKPNSLPVKTIATIISAIELCVGTALIILNGRNIVATGIIYAFGILLMQLLQPLVNTLGVIGINQGNKVNLGVSRGTGSITYAVFAYFFGMLLSRFSGRIIPIAYTISFAFFLAALALFPLKQVKGVNASETEIVPKTSMLEFFKKYKKFTIILLALVGIYIGHLVVNTYMLQIIRAKFAGPEGGEDIMSYSAALLALIEFPMLLLFSKFASKVRCDTLLKISGVFFTAKVIVTMFVSNIWMWYAVQFLQAGGWGLFCVGIVYYVNNLMKKEDVAKGQSYVTTVNTIAVVLGSVVGGSMIDAFGIDALLIFGSVVCAIGTVLFFLFLEKTELVKTEKKEKKAKET